MWLTPDECRDRRARLNAACRAIGRDPATLRLSVFVWVWLFAGAAVDDAFRERVREVTPLQGRPSDPDRLLDELRAQPHCLVGSAETVAASLEAVCAAGADCVSLAPCDHWDLEQIALIGRVWCH